MNYTSFTELFTFVTILLDSEFQRTSYPPSKIALSFLRMVNNSKLMMSNERAILLLFQGPELYKGKKPIANKSVVLNLPNLQGFEYWNKCHLALGFCFHQQPQVCLPSPSAARPPTLRGVIWSRACCVGSKPRQAGLYSQTSFCFVMLCSSDPFSEPQCPHSVTKERAIGLFLKTAGKQCNSLGPSKLLLCVQWLTRC